MRTIAFEEIDAFKAASGLAVVLYVLPDCPSCTVLGQAITLAQEGLAQEGLADEARLARVVLNMPAVRRLRQTQNIAKYPTYSVFMDGTLVATYQGCRRAAPEVLSEDIRRTLQQALTGAGSPLDAWTTPP